MHDAGGVRADWRGESKPRRPAPLASASGQRARRGRGVPGSCATSRRREREIPGGDRRRRGTTRTTLAESARRSGRHVRADFGTRTLAFLARHFGSVFVLALVQRFEARAAYESDADATPTMVADEQIHEEVIRALAGRPTGSPAPSCGGLRRQRRTRQQPGADPRRQRRRGGQPHRAGDRAGEALLARPLSMGAGEYVSVSSQRELLEASAPSPNVATRVDPTRRRRQRTRTGLPRPRHEAQGRPAPATPPRCCASKATSNIRRPARTATGTSHRHRPGCGGVEFPVLRHRRTDPGCCPPRQGSAVPPRTVTRCGLVIFAGVGHHTVGHGRRRRSALRCAAAAKGVAPVDDRLRRGRDHLGPRSARRRRSGLTPQPINSTTMVPAHSATPR